jgi:hypothetical protein
MRYNMMKIGVPHPYAEKSATWPSIMLGGCAGAVDDILLGVRLYNCYRILELDKPRL